MAIPNKISAAIDETAQAAINGAFETLDSDMPFLVDLSPDDIHALPKFGDRSIAFVNKSLDLVKENDNFLPRSFDVDEFSKDVELYSKLNSIKMKFEALLGKVPDTQLMVRKCFSNKC